METAFPLKSAEALLPLKAAVVLLAFAILAGCSGPVTVDAVATPIAPPQTSEVSMPGRVQTETPVPTRTPSPAPSLSPTTTATPISADLPTPDPCRLAGGRIDLHSLPPEGNDQGWDFRIYTPPCYEEEPDRRYPLLVLIHGSLFTDSQWDDLGIDETADALIGSGEIPPFIILMPRDYVFVAPVRDPFDEALLGRVLPWVDANYRTIPDREHRAIGGLSRGASWAVHLGLQHWPLFSAIGAHSLPLFLKDPPLIPGWLAAIPQDSLPRFYLDIGEDDHLVTEAAWFAGLLAAQNIPHEWRLNLGRHEPAYWEAHLHEYLAWYAAEW